MAGDLDRDDGYGNPPHDRLTGRGLVSPQTAPESPLQVSAIPTGPTYYQPVTAVPPVAPVKGQAGGSQDGGDKLRAAQPAGVGTLLDIEA